MSSRQGVLSDYRKILQRGEGWFIRSPYSLNILGIIVFETAFYFAYRYGMLFSQTTASPFWFPDSVLLCALLISRPKRWWIFILAPLPIRLFSEVADGIPMWFLLATYALDSLKGLAAALALRWFLRNPRRLETLTEFAVFCLVAVVAVPAASAFGGAAALAMAGGDYWEAWEQWFMGDALTQLVVTPAILYLIFGGIPSAIVPERRVEAVLLIVVLIATAYLAANTEPASVYFTESRFYAPVPFLFWAAIRFGMFGAVSAITILTLILVQAAIAGHGPFSGQSPADTAAALQSFLLLRAAPLYLVAITIDQRRNLQRFLRESEERFRTIANSAPVLIWISGRDKMVDFVNQSWLAFTGRTFEAELGTGWTEGVHPEDLRYCLKTYHSAFDARQSFEMEYRLRRHNGEYGWILDKGVPRYEPNGDFLGYMGSAIDISDRKRAEELNTTLAHVQHFAALGELSATIAHEVRQPLNAILFNAETAGQLLKSPNPPLDELREVVAEIGESLARANAVITRTLMFSRKQEVRRAPIDINVAVSEVLHLVAGEAAQLSMEIRMELAPSLPLAFGDRTQLQQVLLNLIMNAINAMKDVPESKRRLTLQSKRHGDTHIQVSVGDRGSGIAANILDRVFEPLFTTKEGGTGLGLSIARSIVLAHRGRIWAENNSDGGATFHFTVSNAERESDAAAPS